VAVADLTDMCLVAASFAMVAVSIVASSVMYFIRNESAVLKDITSKWKDFRPVEVYSGYGAPGETSSMDDGIPGTPRRDPRSCFSNRR